METPTYIALSRQTALMRQMEVVANNLANTSTPGFKSESMVFSEYLIKAERPTKLSYVQDFATARDFSVGPITPTGNDLDVAIQGDGFFTIQTPAGPRYTRLGHFTLNAAGQVVNKEGFPVMAGGAPLIIDPDNGPLQVASDGSVSADRTQQGNAQTVYGKLDVVDFADRELLQPEPGVSFSTNQAPIQIANPSIVQRMLEQSNVLPINELTSMIWVQRNYQAVQKFLDAENDRMRRSVNSIIPSN